MKGNHMLSGNGRHRRPRQAPALFVAAGVTGSAIAIPLLGASGASAASGTTWDAVAECESGGSWSANPGNGEYGGLSMTQEEWERYGGLDYAMSADLASRSQQIAVAEKILADRGTSPWATCGLIAGLTQNSDSADVDTGLAQDSPTPTPTPSTEEDPGVDSGSGTGADSGSDSGQTSSDGSVKDDSSDTSGSSGTSSESDSSGTSESSADASQDSDSGPTAESPSPDSSPTEATNEGDSGNSGQNADASGSESTNTDDTDAATGRHRGGSAEEDAAPPRTDDSAGRHASRAGSASRDEADAADGSYTVRSGDSLWSIADSLDLQGGWSDLYAANRQTVGADSNLILPGQRLELGTD
ncbi:transglycosylase family protein [Streptomyces flaveus]|nr:transglycosylase family protein [Streptomyces flaveus]